MGRVGRDGVRYELEQFLEPRGLDLDRFSAQVRIFFDASSDHFDRLAYRDAIADCLGLDMGNCEARDSLWREVGSQRGISRKVIGQWITGEIDPPPDVLHKYLIQAACPGIGSRLAVFQNVAGAVRMAIARTIVYITVFPPEHDNPAGVAGHNVPDELRGCWDRLKHHVHYRTPAKRPRCNLNQDAIDYVHGRFGDRFWVEPDKVGDLMRTIEKDRNWMHPFLKEYLFFKYCTLENMLVTHRAVKNQHRWIWDTTHPLYTDIWRQ